VKKICVVGLGYVGLPLAYELAKGFEVIGYDVNAKRLEELRSGHDSTKELTKGQLQSVNIDYVETLEFGVGDVYIVTVPTPINSEMKPDLSPLTSSCEYLAKLLKKGDLVLFESTVFPGCTRDVCVPILERGSGFKLNTDFGVGYSPERINPGDKINTIRKVKKLVSASSDYYLQQSKAIYKSVVDVGVVVCDSIEIAEAAKVIENTQRDLNIAFMNEVSQLFDKLSIPTLDVISAASTKWNFLEFYPGLVGGHCISIDPYYIIDCAEKQNVDLKIIKSARFINEYTTKRIVEKVHELSAHMYCEDNKFKCSIHIEGLTFKENCPDVRNSKIFNVIDDLLEDGYEVTVNDQWLPDIVKQDLIGSGYQFSCPVDTDIYILALGHDYMRTDHFVENLMNKSLSEMGKIIDIKGVLRSFEVARDRVAWEL